MRLKDRVALVTGGGRGIGKAIVLALAKEGADIVTCDINLENLKEVASEVEKLGRKILIQKVDVSKISEVDDVVKKALDKFAKIDILVNNAGITRDNLILRMSEEEWDQVLDINLKGAFNCLKAVARPMMKARSGRIVNIASVVGMMGNPGQANYAASKAGIIGLTKSAAKELASRGINVNAIAPGFIKTTMTESLSDEVKEKLINQIPLKRLGEVTDVANLVVFLASDDASYITGEVIKVDGGMLM
ncbi:3-oxoacyl-[acyl-carrier-protein] reductase [bacterium]|nr:3-oxoacyl-[acyl-carrier-protein] reductase [bacterium]